MSPRKGEALSEEAKAKAAATRAALGPRLGFAPIGAHRITAETRRPRATGSPGAAIGDMDGKAIGSS